jgi:hypothetical protein
METLEAKIREAFMRILHNATGYSMQQNMQKKGAYSHNILSEWTLSELEQ